MAAIHFVEKCVHGTIGAQCRCNGDRVVRTIPCPKDCPGDPSESHGVLIDRSTVETIDPGQALGFAAQAFMERNEAREKAAKLEKEVERLQNIIIGKTAEDRVTLGVNIRRHWSPENLGMLQNVIFPEIKNVEADFERLVKDRDELLARNEAQAEMILEWHRTHEENAMCQDGHQKIFFISSFFPSRATDSSDCPLCSVRAQMIKAEKILAEGDRLYSAYGLIAGQMNGEPFAAGKWIGSVRDFLDRGKR